MALSAVQLTLGFVNVCPTGCLGSIGALVRLCVPVCAVRPSRPFWSRSCKRRLGQPEPNSCFRDFHLIVA